MTEETKTPQTSAEALDALFATWNRSDAPGLVVGIAQKGKVIYRRGFGLASVESGIANSPKTRMRIGSTSKHFTNLAALLLAEEGKLDLDASIRKYVPELPALEPEPTLRQLMNHLGGYRDHLDLSLYSNGLGAPPKTIVLDMLTRQTGVNYPAGERMMYNNGGYELISIVIERVSGLGFEEFLDQRIFQPMGMTDTVSLPSDLHLLPRVATLHIPLPGIGYQRGIFPTYITGSGAMVSTIDDMLIWLAHLRAPTKVGSPDSWTQMLTRPHYNSGKVGDYCLGLQRENYRGLDTIHHAGGVMGGSCQMLTVPSEDLDIILIVNRGDLNPIELATKVIDILLPEKLQPAVEPAASAGAAALLGNYYAAGSRMLYGVVEQEGKLALQVANIPGVPLLPQADGALGLKYPGMGELIIRPGTEAEGKTASITVDYCGQIEQADRLPEQGPSLAEAAAGLTGKFAAHDMDASATLSFDGELILMEIQGRNGNTRFKLNPRTRDVFAFAGHQMILPLVGTLTVERGGGEVQAFWVNTGRTRHIHFVRS